MENFIEKVGMPRNASAQHPWIPSSKTFITLASYACVQINKDDAEGAFLTNRELIHIHHPSLCLFPLSFTNQMCHSRTVVPRERFRGLRRGNATRLLMPRQIQPAAFPVILQQAFR